LTYSDLFEWIEYHYRIDEFRNIDQLLDKVKLDWMVQGLEFPGGDAENYIRQEYDQFQQSLPYTNPEAYALLEQNIAKQQLVADMLGNGQIMESLSDEMVQQLESPRAEILGIDMTEYATTKETVIAPEIVKFAKPSFFTRIVSRFAKFFGR